MKEFDIIMNLLVYSSVCFCLKGNALQTVKSKDKVKVITVRGTAFEPAKIGSNAAATQPGSSTFASFTCVPCLEFVTY